MKNAWAKPVKQWVVFDRYGQMIRRYDLTIRLWRTRKDAEEFLKPGECVRKVEVVLKK